MVITNTLPFTIKYEKEPGIMQCTWRGHVPGSIYRRALLSSLRIIRKQNVRLWLSDQTLATTLDPEDQDWTNNVWFPKLLQSGIRKMAFILPEDLYNIMVLENMLSKAEGKHAVEVQFFSDAASAREWLLDERQEPVPLPLRSAIA